MNEQIDRESDRLSALGEEQLLHLAHSVGERLLERGFMLATAESCTGGGVADAITAIAGSSGWFDRGFVTYSNLSKQELLGVRHDTLLSHGAVSEQTAREMADGARRHSVAQAAVAICGVKPANHDDDTAPPVLVAVPVLPAAGRPSPSAAVPEPVCTTCCMA